MFKFDFPRPLNPPGPRVQTFNRWLHVPGISNIVYHSFWSFVLIVVSPFLGWMLFFKNGFHCVDVVIRLLLGIPLLGDEGRIDAHRERESHEKDLAVCITGCDTGFGKELAFTLAERGFVVFAGCLSEDGERQFEGISRIHHMRMDVTKQDEIDGAYSTVSSWLNDKTAAVPRFLHAVVNNAGIGHAGLVDWTDMSMYRTSMEVNFFGMVATTKAFLPILKSQAISRSHERSRIINVISMAGLISGPYFSSYSGSKFAAEAFTTSLRMELNVFGIGVVTINPSFHRTPLVEDIPQKWERLWNGLDKGKRQEYGRAFLEDVRDSTYSQSIMSQWDPAVVTDELVSAVEQHSPRAQVPVGLDAKYSILPLRHLPVWVQDKFQSWIFAPRVLPAAMMS